MITRRVSAVRNHLAPLTDHVEVAVRGLDRIASFSCLCERVGVGSDDAVVIHHHEPDFT